MTVIRQEDFVASIAGALQYISYYHPVDYITSLANAYEREESPAARDAIAQILVNSRMCAEGHRPICQDTGIVTAFLKVGMDVTFEAAPGEERKDIQTLVDEGVRRRGAGGIAALRHPVPAPSLDIDAGSAAVGCHDRGNRLRRGREHKRRRWRRLKHTCNHRW